VGFEFIFFVRAVEDERKLHLHCSQHQSTKVALLSTLSSRLSLYIGISVRDIDTFGRTRTMVDHEANETLVMSKPEQTIFTMKGDRNNTNHNDLSNIPVPLSYSSADSATEYASLFGEAIISKDTLFTVTNNSNNGSSGLNTVIMMVDHANGPKGNAQKNNASIENTVADVPQKDEENIVNSSVSIEDPICGSLCSNKNNISDEDVKKEDIIDTTSTSPSKRVFKIKSSLMLPPLSDGSASPRREPLKTVSSMEEQGENRSNEFLDVIGCPCFQPSHLEYHSSSMSTHPFVTPTAGVPNSTSNNSLVDVLVLPKIRSLSLFDENEKKDDDDHIEEEEEEEQFQLDEELMTGIIEETGAHYHMTKIIVEGWIHKKGTGHDWLGSRGWKARWARLAIGYIDGYDNVEVPLLGISWYPTSTNNSTVIVLDSTVVLAVDLPNKDRPHRFEIRHAKSSRIVTPLKHNQNNNPPSVTSELSITRTFSAASRKARDAWVYAISQALLSYEKEKAALRKLKLRNSSDGGSNSPMKQRLSSLQPLSSVNLSPNKTRDYDDIWLNDRFPPQSSLTAQSGGDNRSPSPPLRTQRRTDGRSSSNPRLVQQNPSKGVGRSKSPMIHTSIIGQDGFSTFPTSHDVNHFHHGNSKPMTIHTRSTSA
jgi:hypothetical protein